MDPSHESWVAMDTVNDMIWGPFPTEEATWSYIIKQLKVYGEISRGTKDGEAGHELAGDLGFSPRQVLEVQR